MPVVKGGISKRGLERRQERAGQETISKRLDVHTLPFSLYYFTLEKRDDCKPNKHHIRQFATKPNNFDAR
jgi:hypothetical protein